MRRKQQPQNRQQKWCWLHLRPILKLGTLPRLKNNYLCYSPSTVTATDFSIDTPQDVFIYIKGRTLTSDECLQQTTRTRNIKTLYWYSESNQQDAHYESLDQLKDLIQTSIVTSKSINNCCTYIDADGECKMVENMWFNLWAVSYTHLTLPTKA